MVVKALAPSGAIFSSLQDEFDQPDLEYYRAKRPSLKIEFIGARLAK